MAKGFLVFLLVIQMYCQMASADEGSIHIAHMKPFGAHMPAQSVDEFLDGEVPTPQEFWAKYVKERKPVVFRGAARKSPAFEKWTDEYLAKEFGNLEVRLEARKEKQGYIPVGDLGVGRDTIRNFIRTYHKANKYIVSELPKPMYEDIVVLPSVACGEFSKRIVEVDWWMNGGNASSIIHKDAFNQINCLMNGTKEWKFIEYRHESKIYKAWEPGREIGGYSRVNPEKVDLIKYPKIATVPWMFTTLYGGDCLYLPGSMYHQVKSFGTNNFAISLLFSRFDGRNSLEFSDCNNDSLAQSQLKSLNVFDVDWDYPGTGEMTMGEPDLEYVRSSLLYLAKKKGSFVKNIANYLLKVAYEGKSYSWAIEKGKEVYSQIKMKIGKDINADSVKSMSKDALRVFALAVQPIDASNTYDHEYTYVSPDAITDLVKHMLDADDKLSRPTFVTRYQKELFGTEKFAQRFFDQIAGESASEASKVQVNSNMEKALEKYKQYQRDEPEPPKGEKTDGDAYDRTNVDMEMYETGMPDMTDDSEESNEGQEEFGEDRKSEAASYKGKDEL